MTWKTKYNKEINIIESAFSGRITVEEIIEESKESSRLSKNYNTNRYLSDCTAADFKLSVIDVIDLPDEYKKNKEKKQFKLAIIVPKSKTALYAVEFYKNFFINQGAKVELFDNYKNALKWLVE